MKVLIPTVVGLILFSTNVAAQDISMEEALSFINKKTEGMYQLKIDKRELTIDVYTEEEGHTRQDKVMIDDLDWKKTKYYPNEKSVVIRCEYEGDDCFTRKVILKGLKDHIHRFDFKIENEHDAEAVKKALIHIIRLVKEKKYSSSEPFE